MCGVFDKNFTKDLFYFKKTTFHGFVVNCNNSFLKLLHFNN